MVSRFTILHLAAVLPSTRGTGLITAKALCSELCKPVSHAPTCHCTCSAQVLLHPQWGSAVYPATMFTCAPLELLLAAIKCVEETGVDS